MRTGKTIEKSGKEPHLGKGLWTECYPENPHDVAVLAKIDAGDKAARYTVQDHGQSPMLVRKSALDRLAMQFK